MNKIVQNIKCNLKLQVQFNGRTSAFQAANVGPIPITCSIRKYARTFRAFLMQLTLVQVYNIFSNSLIQKLKEKNKIYLKDLIYLVRKKLKEQLNILTMKWKNQLKIFILIKKIRKKTMAYHCKLSSFIYAFLSFEFLLLQQIHLTFSFFDNPVLLYLIIVVNLLLKYHIHQI